MSRLRPSPPMVLGIIIAAVMTIPCPYFTSSLLLLSDLPTPSFIIDTQALLRRRHVALATAVTATAAGPSSASISSILLPSIRCPTNGIILHPSMISGRESPVATKTYPSTVLECQFEVIEGQPSIGYIHSSVVRAREDAIPGVDDPISTFLAEIDVGCDLCGGNEQNESIGIDSGGARLVLGLNNHHVGSYYWARSAGAGSSMEAPGISFGHSTKGESQHGVLRWINEEGPEACNSNDGKRSEWVNFLRKGDTVQLVPMDGQDTILRFSKRFGRSQQSSTSTMSADRDAHISYSASMNDDRSIRVFGISSQGRPLGSEPEVVCEWTTSRT